MNTYICLMNNQKNLIHRTDENIMVKNTFIYEIIKRDNINKELMDGFYSKFDNSNNRVM
jgi:hypothetical protein